MEQLEDRSLLTTFYVDNTPVLNGPGADEFTPNGGSQSNQSGLTLGSDLFTTIQAAVDVASDGDTINVADGSYFELVVVAKTLNIQGNQFGIDARTRAVGSESTISNGDGDIQVLADNVVIDGFTLTGVVNDPSQIIQSLGAAIWTNPGFSGTHGGTQILNNIIEDNIAGIELANDGTFQTVVQHNLIQNNDEPGAGSGNGIEVDFGLANALIDENRFINNPNTAIFISIGGSDLTISDNVADAQIYLASSTGAMITGNQITNSTGGGIVLGGGNTSTSITNNEIDGVASGFGAFRLRDDGPGPNSGATVTNNKFIGGTDGYGVRPGGASYSGTLTLTDNQISGGLAAIQNDDAALAIDASSNYFGTSNASTVSATILGVGAANVDFTPLLDNDETDPAVGFQADHSSFTVHTLGAQTGVTGRISEAINLLASVGTVKILSGSYTENVSGAGKDVNFSPGGSPAQVTIIGDLTLDSTDTLTIEINGTSAATDYDNFVVDGSVDLGGATLAPLSGTHTPGGSDSFTIISATGTVSNTFVNLPDGSAVSLNGNPLSIDYDTNSVVLSFDSTPVFTGTAGADEFVVTVVGGNIVITQNGMTILMTSVGSLDSLTINGGDGNDAFLLDLGSGNPIPSGGLFYNGNGGDDSLGILGTNGEFVVYTPDAAVNGNGLISIDGAMLTFTGLEPVDFDNVGTFTLSLPGGDDVVDIAEGFNSAVTGAMDAIGTVPALVFSGTSGGAGFESAHVFRTTNVILNTTLISDGDDVITVTSGDNAHGNTNLSIITGNSTVTPDSVSVNGNLTVAGTLTITTEELNVAALADAESTGDNVVLTVENISVLGTITASSGRINLSTAGTHSMELGTVGDAGANTVELSAAELNNLTATVLQLVSNGPTLTVTGPIAPAGTSTLYLSAFTIVDGNAADPDITETNLKLEGLGGIGTTADPLEIDVDNLTAKEGGAGAEIVLRNSGDLTITTVDLQIGIQKFGASGNIDIETTSALNINASVLNGGGGDILLTAGTALNQNDTVSAFGGNGNIELTAGTDATLNWFVSTAGLGTITSTAALTTVSATGNVSTANSDITFHTNDMTIDAVGVIDSGSGTTTIDPVTPSTAISLGTSVAADLELTDAELDQITAGTLTIGNSSAGSATITDAVTRAATTDINIFSSGSIIFSGATGSLDANGGDVTLTTGAAGGVASGDATTDITADGLTITAGSAGIGASGNALTTEVTTLTTDTSSSGGDQYLTEASGLSDLDLDAGTGDITLVVGGQVSDTSNDGTDVTADAFSLTIAVGPSGEFGLGNNFIETDINSLTSSTSNQDRNIYVNEDDNLVIESINAGQTVFPDVHLIVGGNVTSGAGLIVGNGLNLTADGFIDINTTVSQLNLTTTANGNVTVDETNSLVQLNIDAGTGDVVINAGGAITDGDGATDIVANDVTLTATSIGTLGNAISTSADTLTVDTSASNGDQFVTEADGLTDLNLNAGTGNVSLTLTLGSVLDTAADGTDITATDASVTLNDATAQTIGALGNAIELSVSTLATSTAAGNGDQFLADPDMVTVADADMASGTGTMDLVSGTYFTTATGSMLGNVIVESGVTLAGNGTVSGTVLVNSGGTVSPGSSTAILNTGSVTFTVGSDFDVEVNGNVAGTSYDQLNVTGTVTLGGATLNATGTIPSATGQTIVIVKNDSNDPVVGTFAGLPEGETVFINGIGFTISYVGGTGNDVTLTQRIQVTLAVSPASINEDAPGAMIYTFTRDGIADVMTVNFAVSGSATFGAVNDYTQTGGATFSTTAGTVVFGFAQFTATIYVDPVADPTQEPDETVTLTLKPGSGYSPALPNTATGTIVNDDVVITPVISVEVSPASVTEDGATNLVYTFSRTGDLNSSLTANFDVSGSADFGGDYTQAGAATYGATAGSVTFGFGQSTAVVTLDPITDGTIEPDETAILTVATGSGYLVATSPDDEATGTILNDDGAVPSVTVAVSPGSVLEDGTTNLVYTFTRSDTSTEPLTINFDVSGTAKLANTDYTQTGAATYSDTSGTLTFGFAQATATVTVDPTADSTLEGNETLTLTVAAGTGYNVGGANFATGTITNDDVPPPTPGIPDVSVVVSPDVAEDGSDNLIYTFTRTTGLSQALTVDFSVGGSATFGTDYSASGAAAFGASAGSVTFGFGQSTATVVVNPSVDTDVEGNEDVELMVVAGTGYNVGSPDTATGEILDDDVTPVVSLDVSPSSVTEDGAANLIYTFTRAGNISSPLIVNFTVGGGAIFGDDYTQTGASSFGPTGTISFGSGQATASITVNPLTDTTVELNEDVLLTLAAGSGYTTSGGPATGTITNDDATSGISVVVSPISVLENGSSSLIYTFTRSGSVSDALTVNFTVGGDATFNTDYTQTGASTFSGAAGTVTFGFGQMHAMIAINPHGDSTIETDELVTLTVVAGSNYTVGAPNVATGTITNDDGSTPNVSVTVVPPGSVTETSTAELAFQFTRDNTNPDTLTVTFDVDGTADFLSDYTVTGASSFGPTSGTVTFGFAQTTITVFLRAINDGVAEPTETIQLTVTPGTGYNVGAPAAAMGTIADPPPSLMPEVDAVFSNDLDDILA